LGEELKTMNEQFQDEEEDGETRSNRDAAVAVAASDVGRLYNFPSSRIVRVSRASGGKDRHSKVLTSKGLRDRRVRLSVSTAIQFYDLQDRLGVDQPSKAVEWLLRAASSAIDELPPISGLFPGTPKQLSDEKRSSTGGSDQVGFDSPEVQMDAGGGDLSFSQQASESSKCSGRGRSESSRIRRAKQKEKENNESLNHVVSRTTSFTELLSGGGGGGPNESNIFCKSPTPMDYFVTRAGQIQLGGNHFNPLFGVAPAEMQQQQQRQFFVTDQLAPVVNNLSFSISPGLNGLNRGTLQSNSSPPSFFIGATPSAEFLNAYDASRLQLFYGD
ncbi:hypothetical protein M569_06575, partial [Genlisea aurea]